MSVKKRGVVPKRKTVSLPVDEGPMLSRDKYEAGMSLLRLRIAKRISQEELERRVKELIHGVDVDN